jgi:iron(III) transport system permease protein
LRRPAFLIALLCFLLAGILPLAVMLLRITPADLAELADPRTLSLLGRTLTLGGCTALGTLLIGLPFGFLVARSDMPGASWLRTVGIIPLLMPPLLIAMTWAVVWTDLRGASGTIFMLILSSFPLVSIFSARAFERIDGRMEEAALLSGGLRAVLRMELPLVLPAAFSGACFAFAFAINDFGVPDYVSSVGVKFNVYADEIKLNWDQIGKPGKAVATALPIIAITLLALVPALALRRKGAMASIGGDFISPSTLGLGKWRWPAFLFCFGVVGAAAGLPILRLLWESAGMPTHLQNLGFFEALKVGQVTMVKEFGVALELARDDIGRSLLYSSLAALICVPIGLVLGHAIARCRNPFLARSFEALTLLPLAAPALLFGIGIISTYSNQYTARFYESGSMATWLFVGRYLPFAILVSAGAVAALSPTLEEAASLAGVKPFKRLRCIVAPALGNAMVASFVLVFVFAMRDLDSAVLVPAANKTAIFRVFNGVHFGRSSYVAALSLLLVFSILLPGILWSLFARKRLEVLP